MEHLDMLSLIFGSVVLQSTLSGTDLVIYRENPRDGWTTPAGGASLKYPLNQLPTDIPAGHIDAMVERLLGTVREELEATFPGGFDSARTQLVEWISNRNHPACGVHGGMVVKNLPALMFGNVVLHSTLAGTQIQVYSDDRDWYWSATHPKTQLDVPLSELTTPLPEKDIDHLVETLLVPVAQHLDDSYAGGVEKASAELRQWLSTPRTSPGG